MSGGQTGGWGPPRCPHNLQCREEVGGWPGREPAPQPSPAAPRPPEACSGHARARPTPGPPLSAAPPGRAEGDTQHCRPGPPKELPGVPRPTPQGTTSPEDVPESPDPGSQSSVPHPERAPQPLQSLAPRCVQDQGGGALCDPMAPTHISRPPGPRQPPGGSGVWRLFCLDGSERAVQPRME